MDDRRISRVAGMHAALSLFWAAATGRGGPDASASDDSERKGDGHPAPSTILVVEDEVLLRLAITDYLRSCGYRVLEAKTGEEAQAILNADERIEILFAEVDLGPGINGFELAKWTRENFRDVRIILASGVSRMARTAADLCDGPLLRKPYSYEALAERIKNLLGALGKRGGA